MPTKHAGEGDDLLLDPNFKLRYFNDKQLMMAPLIGAGAGGLLGLTSSRKGKRLRNTLLGAAGGGLTGGGAALGYKLFSRPTAQVRADQRQFERDLKPFVAVEQVGKKVNDFFGGEEPKNVIELKDLPAAVTKHRMHNVGVAGGLLGALGGYTLAEESRNAIDAEEKKKRREKRSYDWSRVGTSAGIGSGLGGFIGALRAPKGKMLRYTLGGAGIGGLTGAGASLGGQTGHYLADMLSGQDPNVAMTKNDNINASHLLLGLPGALIGGSIGEHLGNKAYGEFEEDKSKKKNKTMKKKADSPKPMLGSETLGFLRSYPSILKYWMPQSTLAGSVIGAGAGAATGSGALRGALRGGMIGAGAGAGVPLGGGLGLGLTSDAGLYGDGISSVGDNVAIGVPTMLASSAAGGVGGGMAGNALYNQLEKMYDSRNGGGESHKKPKTNKKPAEKKSSAQSFGEKCAAGFDFQKLLPGIGTGAVVGALGGGLAGLMAPGEDEEGRPKSRFGSMLRGALGGAGLGGLAGGVAEHYDPSISQGIRGAGNHLLNYGRGMYNSMFGKKQRDYGVPAPLVGPGGDVQNTEEYMNMLKDNPFYNVTGKINPTGLGSNYLPQYGVRGGRVGPSMQ